MAHKPTAPKPAAAKQPNRRAPDTVIIPAELERGHPFLVFIQKAGTPRPRIQPTSLSDFCRKATDSFLDKPPSVEWEEVHDELWNKKRTIVRVPEDQFRYCKRVKPAVIGVCTTTDKPLVVDASQRAAERKRPVLVILESPHEAEYTKDDSFSPLGPLLNRGGRTRVRKQLPGLIAETKMPWASFVGSEVILINPVPYQASLHRFMKPTQKGVNRGVCNQVWWALFRAKDDQGKVILKSRFLKLIKRLQPGLILNACTEPLWKDVESALEELDSSLFPHFLVNQHPATWGGKTKIVTKEERKSKKK